MLDIIKDTTDRSLWSLNNVIDCIPDLYWKKEYCEMPLWKHIYHTLHSLDRWYVNPFVYEEPDFHKPGLDNLDVKADGYLPRDLMKAYYAQIKNKIENHLNGLTDEQLSETPPGCPYTRFQIILAQHRHLDMHIGMLMGYIIAGEGLWPRVLGLKDEIPTKEYEKYF